MMLCSAMFWTVVTVFAMTSVRPRFYAFASQPADSPGNRARSQSQTELLEGQPQKAQEVPNASDSFEKVAADRRKALRSENSRWPNAIVPYYILPSVDALSPSARQILRAALDHWESKTCIRFVPADTLMDRDVVVFKKGKWCNSIPGRSGGWQPVHLATGCLKVGSIIHELGHVIGWVHEHARPDRDEYLEIQWENVRSAYTSQYVKNSESYINTFGVPYDYGSIMHYNGSSGTITALDPAKQKVMGQRVGLSFYDAKLANLMYNCAERNKCNLASVKCIGEGYVGPKCLCVCPHEGDRCTAEIRTSPDSFRFST